MLLAATLDAIVVERPEPSLEKPQNLCLDKGYDNEPTRQILSKRGYTEDIRRIGEEKKNEQAKNRILHGVGLLSELFLGYRGGAVCSTVGRKSRRIIWRI